MFYIFFHQLSLNAGLGGIMRDHEGVMIAAYASQIKANHSFEAKMQSLLEGLKISKSMQFDKVVIEEDTHPFRYPRNKVKSPQMIKIFTQIGIWIQSN